MPGSPQCWWSASGDWCRELPYVEGVRRAWQRWVGCGANSDTRILSNLLTVPVIAVLTKYDRLMEHAEMALIRQQSGLAADKLSKLAEKKAEADLQTLCIEPLENLVDKDVVPRIAVSSSSSSHCRSSRHIYPSITATQGYEKTLKDLIKLTYNNVFEYIETASVVTAIAQKVNPGVKIDASIE